MTQPLTDARLEAASRIAHEAINSPFYYADSERKKCLLGPEYASRIINEAIRQTHSDKLAEALTCFIEDERFLVAVGGNPIAVDRMIDAASAALAAYRKIAGV